jgi:hypothetical protein
MGSPRERKLEGPQVVLGQSSRKLDRLRVHLLYPRETGCHEQRECTISRIVDVERRQEWSHPPQMLPLRARIQGFPLRQET